MIFEDRIQENPRLFRLKDPRTNEIVDFEIQDLLPSEIVQEGTEIDAAYLNGLLTYTTEEKIIGYWIDGKPIYRRVYVQEEAPYISDDTNIPIGFTNWNEVITLRGIVKTAENDFYPLPAVNYSQTDIYGKELKIISKTSEWQPNTFYVVNRHQDSNSERIVRCIIFFEYTKTTDTVS